ncbi:DUF4386 domain-containing protein [Kribbella sp. NPDC051620]|uniref:DUF4386 domain-containing protein n=1 Tax=Kribbella sp. NPDC051620 TaxID=3364120 RepID=UPI0037B99690
MTTITRTTAPPQTSRDSLRRTALVAGICYLITFVASIPALPLYSNLVGDPKYILGSGSSAGVLLGGLLEVITALAGIGTAVVLFPVVKRQSEWLALGFVTSRVIEGAYLVVGVIAILSVVTLRENPVAGTDPAALITAQQSLVAIHDWSFLLGPGVMPGVNALLLGTLLYRSGLVPRLIPLIGLVGAPFFLVSAVALIFGAYAQLSLPSGIATVPIFIWELSLGLWLTFKGFKPSPITQVPNE